MNREILFRGKRKDNAEWIEGYYEVYPDGKEKIVRKCDDPPDGDPMWKKVLIDYEVDPETVCQYTGLTDTNLRKIFEGDICIIHSSSIDEEDGYFIVEWDKEEAKFIMCGRGLSVDFGSYYVIEIEVIGNIFDNPELIH